MQIITSHLKVNKTNKQYPKTHINMTVFIVSVKLKDYGIKLHFYVCKCLILKTIIVMPVIFSFYKCINTVIEFNDVFMK